MRSSGADPRSVALPVVRERGRFGSRNPHQIAGVTAEQSDAVHDIVNPNRSPPPGLIFHAWRPIDGGWGIIDFWS